MCTKQIIFIESKAVFELVMKKAWKRKKRKMLRRKCLFKFNSFKRKYVALAHFLGISTLIGSLSGKMIDAVKSSFCQNYVYWKNKNKGTEKYAISYDEHEENCSVKYTVSAGKMEIDNIKEMFLRSEEFHGVKYINYINILVWLQNLQKHFEFAILWRGFYHKKMRRH